MTSQVRALFRVRAFRFQFGAQAVSMVGSTLSPVALAIGVLELTGSPADFSLVLAAASVPTVAFLLAGGVWADRLPRHKIMVAANLLCAMTQAAMGVMLATGHFRLWLAMLLQFVTGTALAFYFPATNGLTAITVPAVLLQKANALLSLTKSLAGSTGPLAAGLLLMTIGAGWALLVDSLTFMLSASLLARISVPQATQDAKHRRPFVRDLAEGFREVVRRSWVWSSIVAFMFSHVATAVFLVLGPALLISRNLPPIAWGAMIAGLSVGQVIGDVAALRLVPRRPMVAARLVELLYVPVLVALAAGASLPVLIAAAIVAGVALTFPDSLWYTALQQHLPTGTLSRVSSYDWLGSLALRPVGYIGAAALASMIGASTTFLAVAVLVVITRLTGLLFADVRRLTSVTIRQTTPVFEQATT